MVSVITSQYALTPLQQVSTVQLQGTGRTPQTPTHAQPSAQRTDGDGDHGVESNKGAHIDTYA